MGSIQRTFSLSRSGRFVAHRITNGIALIDTIGRSPPHRMLLPDGGDFACVGEMLWVLAPGTGVIDRYALQGLRPLLPAIQVGPEARRILPSAGEHAVTALVTGKRNVVAFGLNDEVSTTVLEAAGTLFPLTGRHVLAVAGDLRLIDASRGELVRMPVLEKASVLAVSDLFAGRAIALLTQKPQGTQFIVLHPMRGLLHQFAIPQPRCWAIAENRGIALVIADEEVLAVDLRYGRIQERHVAPATIHEIAIDADAQFVAFLGAREDAAEPPLMHTPYTEFMMTARRMSPVSGHHEPEREPNTEPPATATALASSSERAETLTEPVTGPRLEQAAAGSVTGPRLEQTAAGSVSGPRTRQAGIDSVTGPATTEPASSMTAEPAAAVAVTAVADSTTGAPGIDGWTSVPRAWPRLAAFRQHPTAAPMPPTEVAAYLGDTRGLLAALCQRSIAQRPDTTARSPASSGDRPVNEAAAGAPLDDARAQEHAARAAHARWSRRGAPHVELAVELGLSSLGMTILIVAAGPALWGELAAAYDLVANTSARTPCDEHLVAQLLDADPLGRLAIARELDEHAPLVRTGLVELGPGRRPFRELIVPDVVVRRLAGDAVAKADPLLGLTARFGEIDQPLWLAPGTLDDVLATLTTADPAGRPVRVVVRGRPGTGRTTLAAALAATAERGLAVIEGISGAGDAAARRLRQQLGAALLRGLVPCVAPGLLDDVATHTAIERALEDHPGPVIVRAAPDEEPPLHAGYLTIALDIPAAAARHGLWLEAAARHGIVLADGVPGEIADRFALGPGAIDQIAAQLGRAAAGPIDAATATRAVRRRRQRRIEHVADRVDRLASWDDVVLPAELAAGVRALIGRIRNRRAVLERWGMEHVATTGRGVTALLQGGPGTGKTLVAGLIAREVGYELYRIDLSKVVSKWIGETEKNLGAVFDAAEAGEVVLLFDEADALFARRTDVRSSNDRHANLEVNYLLQRLDSFTGVAVLTTNFGTAIDPAFRRRLAMRLEFPLPDEAERARLWRIHLPASLPQHAPALDELAGRYAMSGAYIRNAALRAAFLAADRAQAIDTALLREAIEAEYREAGKIEAIGTLQ